MTFLKKMWTVTYVILITIVFLSLFFWIIQFFLKSSQPNDTWIKSYCQISKILPKNGPNVHVYYWVKDSNGNSKIVLDQYAPSLGLSTPIIGEVFPIIYDPNNINEFDVFSWKPSFLTNEKTKLTVGSISRAPYQVNFGGKSEIRSTHCIEFKFLVNGKNYIKVQRLQPIFIETYPLKIKKGDKFSVEYLPEVPLRAIIRLDNPVP